MTVTVIRSGTVVPGDGTASLPGTDVVIVDGAVRDLPSSDPERPYDRADLVIDAAGKVVLPGLINNHTHGTAFGPLFPSGHEPLPDDQVVRNLDRHLLEGTTTVLCVDGFMTAEQIARTNAAHPVNVKAASCNTPSCLRAAQIADGGGLREDNVRATAEKAVRDGAVALGEIGAGHTLGGGGASYMYIPQKVRELTGETITPAQANALKYTVLGRHIDRRTHDRDEVAAVLTEIGLIDLMTPEDAADIVRSVVLPAFEVALHGLAEAAEHARRHGVPVLVHNAAASMKQVAEIARIDVRLIAGHSNHSSFTVEEAVEHAAELRKSGVVVDVSTLDGLGARRLLRSPETMFAMLREGLVDTISTDYAGGYHDPILLAISKAVEDGATTLPAAVAMAGANVADAVPGLAPNRGRIGPGAVADIVVADAERLDDVRWVLIDGRPAVADGELVRANP
ncbi:amidohydrolase family protein [Actinomadura madurae]|uniref:amidohydrolase family protein n=1 Tax=Actinomadura madurae TaxID=1993 RepID=UPI002026320F|nr:amidohydrolase family protein [Actinomadura madurae]MCP9952583.1 amidohydrolase family protein [Actinomadura madurae]MCP9981816.1 amidohydrolase family protein [Actinomadura madurae]MCQ0018033.1 amidohydrolase family protein [Actinomadura madurae]URN08786.1 amidohydrolase family protein [Actinomadura madurae]